MYYRSHSVVLLLVLLVPQTLLGAATVAESRTKKRKVTPRSGISRGFYQRCEGCDCGDETCPNRVDTKTKIYGKQMEENRKKEEFRRGYGMYRAKEIEREQKKQDKEHEASMKEYERQHQAWVSSLPPLFQAVDRGADKDELAQLIKKGANVDELHGNWYTPLILAIQRHHPHTVKALLELGANPNLKGLVAPGTSSHLVPPSPIREAAGYNGWYDDGTAAVVGMLLRAGANDDDFDWSPSQASPTAQAAYKEWIELPAVKRGTAEILQRKMAPELAEMVGSYQEGE